MVVIDGEDVIIRSQFYSDLVKAYCLSAHACMRSLKQKKRLAVSYLSEITFLKVFDNLSFSSFLCLVPLK